MTEPDRLDAIRVASPCPADWNAMHGDDRRRFCAQCKLHVYDLSAMPREEARALVERSEGRLCVRFFRRADGTVLTQDCPVGLRQKLRAARVRAMAMAGALLSLLLGCVRREPAPVQGRPVPPAEPPKMLMGEMQASEMGDLVVPRELPPSEMLGRVRVEGK